MSDDEGPLWDPEVLRRATGHPANAVEIDGVWHPLNSIRAYVQSSRRAGRQSALQEAFEMARESGGELVFDATPLQESEVLRGSAHMPAPAMDVCASSDAAISCDMTSAGLQRLRGSLLPPPLRVAVIAGNHREFVQWCRENGESPHGDAAIYASSSDRLRGFHPYRVVYAGTWYARRDLLEIERALGVVADRPTEDPTRVYQDPDDLSDEDLRARAPRNTDWTDALPSDGAGMTLDELLGNIDEALEEVGLSNEERYNRAVVGDPAVVALSDLDDYESCPSRGPRAPFMCTRPIGHQGQHVAEDRSRVADVWPNEEER